MPDKVGTLNPHHSLISLSIAPDSYRLRTIQTCLDAITDPSCKVFEHGIIRLDPGRIQMLLHVEDAAVHLFRRGDEGIPL